MGKKTEEIIDNIPEIIFLQITDRDDLIEGGNFINFEAREIGWCESKVFDQDIEYILKSKSDQLITSTKEECAKEMKTLIRTTFLNVRKRTDDTKEKDLILILMAILAKAIRDKNEL